MKALLQKVMDGKTLSREEASEALKAMTSGQTPPEMIAAFLGAIRARRETSEELVGFIGAARELSVPIGDPPDPLPDVIVDVCGTGGDGANTFNISTTVAFVVAGAGVGVAKHGNRSVSSLSGSADVLELLGARTDMEAPDVLRSMARCGFGFFFAPKFHPAFKAVGPVRKAMGVRTVFNLLGPLINPARVKRQLIGVYDPTMLGHIAVALRDSGTEEAMVVCSEDGLDELSLATSTRVVHLANGDIRECVLSADDAGITRAPLTALKGGDAQENSKILISILEGETGPRRDVVVLNAAAALMVAGKAKTLKDGARLAGEVIDSGAARKALERVKEPAR